MRISFSAHFWAFIRLSVKNPQTHLYICCKKVLIFKSLTIYQKKLQEELRTSPRTHTYFGGWHAKLSSSSFLGSIPFGSSPRTVEECQWLVQALSTKWEHIFCHAIFQIKNLLCFFSSFTSAPLSNQFMLAKTWNK